MRTFGLAWLTGVSAPRRKNYKQQERNVKIYVQTIVCIEGVPEETQKYVIINQSSGKFFEVYVYDAFIFNYLFDYKIIQAGKTYKCGFPDSSLVKITNKLNDL